MELPPTHHHRRPYSHHPFASRIDAARVQHPIGIPYPYRVSRGPNPDYGGAPKVASQFSPTSAGSLPQTPVRCRSGLGFGAGAVQVPTAPYRTPSTRRPVRYGGFVHLAYTSRVPWAEPEKDAGAFLKTVATHRRCGCPRWVRELVPMRTYHAHHRGPLAWSEGPLALRDLRTCGTCPRAGRAGGVATHLAWSRQWQGRSGEWGAVRHSLLGEGR